jgi:type IV pilus assembly protein PilW
MNRVAQRHSNSGFSLIEILVGMTLGLLGIIVMFQVFAVAEGYRRTTTSGGDAQQGGAVALFSIERDVRQAGHSLNDPAFLGCRVNAYDAGPPARNFAFTLAPVVITQGAGGAPDTITVTYGSSSLYATPVSITQNMVTPFAAYQVDSRYGFAPGDLMVAVELGKDCSLAEATSLPSVAGQTDLLLHDTGNYMMATGTPAVARYNRMGGLPAPYDVSYTTNAKLLNLGAQPSNNVYSIQGGNLAMQSSIANAAAPQAIVEGIVDLQAQYGKDDGVDNGTVTSAVYAADDGVVDHFDTVTPNSAAEWARVLSVRLAVVARSNLPEKPDPATGLCSTTAAAPTWTGGAFDLSANAEWRCYRYKVMQTTVPVRNIIWKP